MEHNESFDFSKMIKLQGILNNLNFDWRELNELMAPDQKHLKNLKLVLSGSHMVVKRPDLISEDIPQFFKKSGKEQTPMSVFSNFETKLKLKGNGKGIFYSDKNGQWKKLKVEFKQIQYISAKDELSRYAYYENFKKEHFPYDDNFGGFCLPGANIGKHFSREGIPFPKNWPMDKRVILPGTIYMDSEGKRYLPCFIYDKEDGDGYFIDTVCLDSWEPFRSFYDMFMIIKRPEE